LDAVAYLVIFAVLLLLGIIAGGMSERGHFRRLAKAEEEVSDIQLSNLKSVPHPETVEEARMVMGNVVIATDYFKTLLTSLRNLVGGEMKAAQRLLVRARREAIVRMLREARALGANEVRNVRFQFCSVSMMRGKKGAMQVELLAWGTAVRRAA